MDGSAGESSDLEGMPPGRVHTGLAPTADFIEADGCKRADQGKSGYQRKQKRQGIVAGCPGRKDHADNRIDQEEKHEVRWLDHEVVETALKRVEKIGQPIFLNLICSSESLAPAIT